jgi:hypothetical protein
MAKLPSSRHFHKKLSNFYPQAGTKIQTSVLEWFYIRAKTQAQKPTTMILIQHHLIKKKYLEKSIPISYLERSTQEKNNQKLSWS